MKILVTGASGLIGSALVPLLAGDGHAVGRLVRTKPQAGQPEVHWDPAAGFLDVPALAGYEAVVHLAGENIAAGRWSAQKKARIRNSRVEGTHLLAEGLAQLQPLPKVMVCSSAVGFYGDRGSEILREESEAGRGFLADVCQDWENAAKPAASKGVRVVFLRTGIVLTPKGGALAKMLPPFRLGIGGVIGSGNQYWSWISLDDLLGAIRHALVREDLSGPVNGVAPNPATVKEFTRTLGKVLRRPTVFPMPAFAARLALGEMADEMLLSSTRVEPARLTASGYVFRHPTLEGALRHALGR